MTSVALVDDHPVFREVVGLLLRQHRDLDVVGEAGTTADAFRLIQDASPSVVLLDLRLPHEDGLDVARWARGAQRHSKFLVLSVHEEPAHVARAVKAGVDGYAFKSQPSGELAEAIRAVASGQRYFAPSISLQAVDELLRAENALARLTSREREVFDLAVRGRSTKDTAQLLSISPRTVETHRGNLMAKLEVASVVDLVRLAAKLGVLPD